MRHETKDRIRTLWWKAHGLNAIIRSDEGLLDKAACYASHGWSDIRAIAIVAARAAQKYPELGVIPEYDRLVADLTKVQNNQYEDVGWVYHERYKQEAQ